VFEFVKVCELDELPPGKGKMVRLGGREVYVYNREGRIFAAMEERAVLGAHAGSAPPGEAGPLCRHPGSTFEVEQDDSPARMHTQTGAIRVRLFGDSIYVAFEQDGRSASLS
jgi:nitrite reductase/ring-hydroxylating ferredoxin subunit